MEIYTANLRLLKKYYPELYRVIIGLKKEDIRFEIIEARNGDKTAKVTYYETGHEKSLLMHSKFDPSLEGEKFAVEKMSSQKKHNILYGFSFGYHVKSMVKELKQGNMLYIFDTNLDLFIQALKYQDFTEVFSHKDVKLFLSNDINYIGTNLSKIIKGYNDVEIITHVPSLTSMGKEFEELKFILEEVNIKKSINNQYLSLMEENSRKNRVNIKQNVGLFFNKFIDIPIIIVAAGPSLDKNVHLLSGIENKAVIIAVGEALKTLMGIGVVPNFIITIDPGEITYKQIEGYEDLNVPLILMATAAAKNAEKYRGPKFIACQSKAYLNPGEENYLVKTGGSVSTTALDIAIKMGGNPIIFIGQDLAYSDNRHHCEKSTHEDKEVSYLKNMRVVKGWQGEEIPTTLGMLSFKKWIENRVRNEKGKKVINATEGGAYIEGLRHMKLQEAIRRFVEEESFINKVIKEIVKQ